MAVPINNQTSVSNYTVESFSKTFVMNHYLTASVLIGRMMMENVSKHFVR